MGVHGLWKLIESAGKPVPVETLDNKVLAVDVSIWLHQLMKGYQNPSNAGANVSNAYLLGLFTRVCKLLFTNVKPVFVFDGGVPQLKRKTIAARQQQRNKAEQISEKLREQLLKNLLKQKAVSQVLEEIRGQSSPKKKAPDMYELPPLPDAEDSPSDVEVMSDSSSEEDVKPFKIKYKDLHSIDVNSADFKALPADMRHDILSELKETRKQNSWGRIHEMPEESGDFSSYQMSRLLKRRSVQVSLEEAEKEMGGRTLSVVDVEALLAEGGVEINPQLTKRIASDETTRFIYVRESEDQPKSVGDKPSVQLLSTNSNESSSSKGSLNPNITIKEEIIDCDELLSDSELIEEVEAIEMMYKVKKEPPDTYENTVKIKQEKTEYGTEENTEFGTEDMFDNESSSEGVIIDEMDLIKDNSGLSQSQILALIKQQNDGGNSETNISVNKSVPSTSKVGHLQDELEEKSNSNEAVPLNVNTNSSESKILDSVYFKINKNIKSVVSKKITPTKKNSKVSSSTSLREINKACSLDLSIQASNSSDSEVESRNNLPCLVSEVVLPNSKKEISFNKTSITKPKKETPQLDFSSKTETCAVLSSSESDDEFLEVSPADDLETSALANREGGTIQPGLHIEIQPVNAQIENDIFADIFLDKNKNIESESESIKSSKENNFTDNHKSIAKNNTSIVSNNQSSEIKEKHMEHNSNGQSPVATLEVEENTLSKEKSNKFKLDEYQNINVVKNILPDNADEDNKPSSAGVVNELEDTISSSVEDSETPTPPNIDDCPQSSSTNVVNKESISSNLNREDTTQNSLHRVDDLANQNLSSFEKENPTPSTSLDSDVGCSVDDPATTSSNVTAEERPKRKLNTKQLEKLQDILETKERELVLNQNREDRMATSLTDQMYQEAQELLRLFGVPYIVAPMEAEAQCAFMDSAGLTQGTITDDSDIWLFGGNKVYKNFFDQKKFVLEFQAKDIQHYFRLSRGHLVLLALLVGSDYTVGLQGVGAVTALEILATFPPARSDTPDSGELLSCLNTFKQWWQTQSRTHEPLAKKLKNIDLSQGFPSPAVASAYLQPTVDDSREPFSWGSPDLPGLRDYAERKFGWSRSRTDQILQPVLNRMSQTTSQLTLHTFFGAVPNITAHREQMSRRVQSAVNRLEGGREDFEPVQPRARQPRGAGPGRRRGRGAVAPAAAGERRGGGVARGAGRCMLNNHESCSGDGCSAAADLIPQKEKDKMEALKRKQEAIEIFKNKSRKGVKKRKNIRQIKSEANLSESSSEEN